METETLAAGWQARFPFWLWSCESLHGISKYQPDRMDLPHFTDFDVPKSVSIEFGWSRSIKDLWIFNLYSASRN